MTKPRGRRRRLDSPPPPAVPDLVSAPELAVLYVLEHALDGAKNALLAEHPSLIDDLWRRGDDGPIVDRAYAVCIRAIALRDALVRYRLAVGDAAAAARAVEPEADLPF